MIDRGGKRKFTALNVTSLPARPYDKGRLEARWSVGKPAVLGDRE